MSDQEIKDLLERYATGNCTEEEQLSLEIWLHQEASNNDYVIEGAKLAAIGQDIKLRIQAEIAVPVKRLHWWKFSAAAMFFLVLSVGLLFFMNRTSLKQLSVKDQTADIQPGGNKAILTLADGKKVVLDEALTGPIADQMGVSVRKTADGELIYTVKDLPETHLKQVYNTIETPRGGQYQVNLPDGTRVWLNSESSLKYPTIFASANREVELIGEGYFEVAKDKTKPFIVHSNDLAIRVLGTHFNIANYQTDPVSMVSLLEGSVNVASGNQSRLLIPGQQAFREKKAGQLMVRPVNIATVASWKDDLFVFDDEPLPQVMNKIARWYNVSVVYESLDPKLTFSGTIPRNSKISVVLKQLEGTGNVRFKITGNQLLVSGNLK